MACTPPTTQAASGGAAHGKPEPGAVLRAYLEQLPHGGVTAFAKRLGIGRVHLGQLASGRDGREPSAALAVQIERLSGGAVMRWWLRADWADVWPELTLHPRAPPAPGKWGGDWLCGVWPAGELPGHGCAHGCSLHSLVLGGNPHMGD